MINSEGPESGTPNRTPQEPMITLQSPATEILSSRENIEAWREAVRIKLAQGAQTRAGFNLMTSAGYYPVDGHCQEWQNDHEDRPILILPNLLPITVLRVLVPVTHRQHSV